MYVYSIVMDVHMWFVALAGLRLLVKTTNPILYLIRVKVRMQSYVSIPSLWVLIMEYFVKISKKARILELKRRYLKNTVMTSNTPYPSRKIRRIYFEANFPAIVYNDVLTSNENVSPEPTGSEAFVLRYQIEEYTKDIVHDFEQRLDTIFGRQVNWVHALHFAGLTDEISRGQAPKKVTATDLFYLRSMDQGTANVPYLLALYLFRHTERRKSRARMSEGYFIRRLAKHFGLISDEGLMGLSVIAHPITAAGALEVAEGAPDVDEGAQAIPSLVQEVHGIQESLAEQREVMETMARDFFRFTIWAASSLSQLLDATGATYKRYSDTHVPYQRRMVRHRTGEASTSAAPLNEDQPDP
ncbi:hypothetical protein Tco_0742198 [Tanacetum coccineum]